MDEQVECWLYTSLQRVIFLGRELSADPTISVRLLERTVKGNNEHYLAITGSLQGKTVDYEIALSDSVKIPPDTGGRNIVDVLKQSFGLV